ncbi:MAG: hypothetical protein ACRDQZ_25570 [Mycobacteriales bacterium]
MARVIEFVLVGETEARARISGTADRVEARLLKRLNSVDVRLQRHIQSDLLSGQVLKSHTGNLKRAVVVIPAERKGDDIVGGVGLGREAPYGLAHEFGANIPERVPINAKALHWITAGGEHVFAMRAKAFTLPERSFMRRGFADFTEIIESEIREGVGDEGGA